MRVALREPVESSPGDMIRIRRSKATMSDCVPFRLYVGDQIVSVVTAMVAEMQTRGITVTSAGESGTFSILLPIGGTISGAFSIVGKSIAVSITQRPGVVSCGTIESKLQDLILEAKAAMKNRRPQ